MIDSMKRYMNYSCLKQEDFFSETNAKKITFIHCQDAASENAYSMPEYFTFLCRKFQLLPNERSTLLSSMDQLVALQLCWAEKNKEVRRLGDQSVIQNHGFFKNS